MKNAESEATWTSYRLRIALLLSALAILAYLPSLS